MDNSNKTIHPANPWIAKESLIIIGIGIVDMITTLFWVGHNGAKEANPLFSHYLNMGQGWFAAMKLVLLLGPVFLLEVARRARPKFTLRASRFVVGAYLALYVFGVAALNRPHPKDKQVMLAVTFPSGSGTPAFARSPVFADGRHGKLIEPISPTRF